MSARVERWEANLREYRQRTDWREIREWGARQAVLALAHLAVGATPTASIHGKGWRAVRIGQQIVHWHVESHDWTLCPPGPRWTLAGDGIIELWMLVHDCQAHEAAEDITRLLTTAYAQTAA